MTPTMKPCKRCTNFIAYDGADTCGDCSTGHPMLIKLKKLKKAVSKMTPDEVAEAYISCGGGDRKRIEKLLQEIKIPTASNGAPTYRLTSNGEIIDKINEIIDKINEIIDKINEIIEHINKK